MWSQLFAGALVSFVNFGIHALITGVLILATRHTARRTDHLHVFMRVTALMTVTLIGLFCAHVCEIAVWATYYDFAGVSFKSATPFEFAFAELLRVCCCLHTRQLCGQSTGTCEPVGAG